MDVFEYKTLFVVSYVC